MTEVVHEFKEIEKETKEILHQKYFTILNTMLNFNVKSIATSYFINFNNIEYPPYVSLMFSARNKNSECGKFWRYEFFNKLKTFVDLTEETKKLIETLEKKDKREIYIMRVLIGVSHIDITVELDHGNIDIKTSKYGFAKCNMIFEYFMNNITKEN